MVVPCQSGDRRGAVEWTERANADERQGCCLLIDFRARCARAFMVSDGEVAMGVGCAVVFCDKRNPKKSKIQNLRRDTFVDR